jgi:hypothetical protein
LADINTNLDIALLHTQVQAQIAAQFPAFKTVQFYEDDEAQTIPTPAILLEVSEVEPNTDHDDGTDQLPALIRFEARIMMGIRTPKVKLATRMAAMALGGWLHKHSWGNGVNAGPCKVLAISPDEFDPRVDKWCVWRVEWHNGAMLGTDTWDNVTCSGGPIPVDYYSFAPKIGPGYQNDYLPAEPPLP